MAILEKISDTLNQTEEKKHDLRRAMLTLLLEWKDLESHLELTQKCFQESFTELESREYQLHAVQESATQSTKELECVRKSIETRFHEVKEKESEFYSFQEHGIRELKIKKDEMDIIRREVKLRVKKMEEQEKLIGKLFESIEMERKQFEGVRKSVKDGLKKIGRKEQHIEQCLRDIEQREKIHQSKEEEFMERVKALELREKELDCSQKEKPSSGSALCQMTGNSYPSTARTMISETSAGNLQSTRGRQRSKAWLHFRKSEEKTGKCTCNYCHGTFPWVSKRGSSHLLRHISGGCPAYQKRDAELEVDGQERSQQYIQEQNEEMLLSQSDALKNGYGPEPQMTISRTCVVQKSTHRESDIEPQHLKDPSFDLQPFWTSCPFCNIKHQYPRSLVCQPLRCKRCSRRFTAFNVDAQDVVSHQQKDNSKEGDMGGNCQMLSSEVDHVGKRKRKREREICNISDQSDNEERGE